MRKNKIIFMSLVVGLMVAGFSGCSWDSTAYTKLYNDDGSEIYAGPECKGQNIFETNDGTKVQVNRCKVNEYCNDGKCEQAGEECEGATEGSEGEYVWSENKTTPSGSDTHNGFGYCLPTSQCVKGKDKSQCQQATVSCTEANKAEVCGIDADCINGACKCGNIDCPGTQNTCFKDDNGEALGCVNPETDRDNCGTFGNKCNDGFICSNKVCSLSCPLKTIACDRKYCTTPEGLEYICDGKCVTPEEDMFFCGAKRGGACDNEDPESPDYKGKECLGGTSCQNSECKCSEGFVECKGQCINYKTDMLFCGAKFGGACNNEDPESLDYKGQKCPDGMACQEGLCVASCLEGQVFCNGNCIIPETDPNFCGAKLGGACDNEDPENSDYKGKECLGGTSCQNGVCKCQEGFSVCNEQCVNLKSDKDHCGECGNVCNANAQICVDGTCQCPVGFSLCGEKGCVDLATTHRTACDKCQDTWGNCDNDWENGCETNLMTDTKHCRGCNKPCDPGTFCSNANCSATCGGGLTKCSVDGVEACYNTTNDANHCGACNQPCPKKDNATASCAANACIYTCKVGYTNCGSSSDPECIKLDGDDVNNCGTCGNKCAILPNVLNATCEEGKCKFDCQKEYGNCNDLATDGCEVKLAETNRKSCTSCDGEFRNCDGSWTNGCESDPKVDSKNCNACNNSCATGQVCSGGQCTTSCLESQKSCDGNCLTLENLHLSDCGVCEANWCDGDKTKLNGCEIQVGTSPLHCTACGQPCDTKTNATAFCNAETCNYFCNTGYTNCGTNTDPNCVNLKSNDADNCGMCGNQCSKSLPNVQTATCASGVCQITTCKDGYANCDGSDANGCEVDGSNNLQYCGASGTNCADRDCNVGEVCNNGNCTSNCTGNLTNCNGLCVDITNNPNYCGSCDTQCGIGQSCVDSHCACTDGEVFCSSKCINPSTDKNHCGAKGNCTDNDPENANYAGDTCTGSEKCIDGECKDIYACPAGQIKCSDLCIVPGTDKNHCGAKGNCTDDDPKSANYEGDTCTGSEYCIDGECQNIGCVEGQVRCGGVCINPKTDIDHCGAKGACSHANAGNKDYKGTKCDGSKVCINGACAETGGVSCSGEQINCGGVCINPKTDIDHCGAKGTCTGSGPTNSAGSACFNAYTKEAYCNAGICKALECQGEGRICNNPSNPYNKTCVNPTDKDTCGDGCKKCSNSQTCRLPFMGPGGLDCRSII